MFKVLVIILGGIFTVDQLTFEKYSEPNPVLETVIYTSQKTLEEEIREEEIDCLTRNIYFEARNQSTEGQYAVAEVVLNRAENPDFPENICEIVQQKNERGCQFSWYCDGKSDKMRDKRAIIKAKQIAIKSLEQKTNYTNGALFYHANYVTPDWQNLRKTAEIEDHIFYSSI
jgi:spore germination cell wall hydrolase CwlJ-like protein